MYQSSFNIKARAPFDFDLSCRIFSDGDKNIKKSADNHFWQVINIKGKLIFLYIESTGDVENPELKVELESEEELSSDLLNNIPPLVHKIFNLGLDLHPFYAYIKKDKIMNQITNELYGLKNPITSTLFESLVDSIIEQQISLNAAHNIENRFIKRFGLSIRMYGKQYFSYPSPEDLAYLDLQKLRDCGLSFRKAEYIRDLSLNIVNQDLDLDNIQKMATTDEMIMELGKIRGVGVWTAELALLRGLGRLNAIPADDVGLQRIISHFYLDGRDISSEEVREIASTWGKWKGLAGYYLIVAELMDI
ncbi:DNA-3-methyladenine glycosylase family protein [Methanobacterium ferruginis]|uniref:DNA-3-methyladenine glycosylase family protein n=1 Tax=Methanobacterium ferruginis TaxID=710191 RepID=UPI002573F38F|nr:DNA-3-methyladenine glycosylase 2 family protein [Methanobacterium ferruginis]BDZ69161.1 DNA-3-methyladenine glycosylase 2 family protein [Methanobacterium ferruginis]